MPIQHSYTTHGVNVVDGYSRIRRVQIEFLPSGVTQVSVHVQGFVSEAAFLANANDPLVSINKVTTLSAGARSNILSFLEGQLLTAPEFSGGVII